MSGPSLQLPDDVATPLHDDLAAMLRALREVEDDLFALLQSELRERPMPGDAWSPKDLRAHVAAWRGIEARRLAGKTDGDPRPDDPIEETNARLHAASVGRSWEEVAEDAHASLDHLGEAVRASSVDVLCECGELVAGIGANGINHGIGHLGDVARLAGDAGIRRFAAFSDEIEAVLRHNRLPPRDSGVMLYNLACFDALVDRPDAARERLRAAFARRPELIEVAPDDADLAVLRDELPRLAAAASAS